MNVRLLEWGLAAVLIALISVACWLAYGLLSHCMAQGGIPYCADQWDRGTP